MLNEKELFLRSLELPADERDAFLEGQCSGDKHLANRVQRLLVAHRTAEDFLESLPGGEPNRVARRLRRSAPSDEVPGDQIGRYRLLELIGEGAWGTVWIAQQTEGVDRRVAVKILKRDLNTEGFLARFQAEQRMLAMMDHPHIARVIDAGATPENRPYLVMELVKGVPIIEFADKNRLGVRERVGLFAKVCRALHHAHRKGVVHRDLKPSNILVSSQYDEALPKVIDFGVAKYNQSRSDEKTPYTSFRSFVGTPVYSSPEQLEFAGRDVDARSDVYSLGALLYELLCGKAPFNREGLSQDGMEAFVRQVLEETPLRPGQRFAKLSTEERERIASRRHLSPARLQSLLKDELDWIVLKCLEKDPSQRYETAKDLADDLQAYLEGGDVAATRPIPIRRIRKFIKKRRPVYAAWIEVSVAAIIAFSVFSHFRLNSASSGVTPEKSIAVLPLENMSPDPENAYFADGVQEDVIANLSKFREILVIARSSTLGYRDTTKSSQDIGEELGVRYLVEGSVRREGSRVQVNARLIDSLTGGNLWADNYNRSLDDIFAIQAEVASEIAAKLEAVLTSEAVAKIERRPTENQEAYDYFLKANLGGSKERIALYEKAVALDPSFAEAWAYLAWHRAVQWKLAKYRNDSDLLADIHHAMGQALRINPDLPHVLHAQSNLALIIEEDYQQSIDYLLKALEIDPNFVNSKRALALRYRNIGRLSEAQHYFEATLRADPLGRSTNKWLIDVYLARELWEEAKALIDTNLARSNEDGFWSQYRSWADFWETGDKEAYAKALSLSPRYRDDPFVRSAKLIIEREFPGALKSLDQIDWPIEWGESWRSSGPLPFWGAWEIQAPLICFELGSQEEIQKELEKVRRFLSEVLENDPLAHPLLWSNIAICHALTGDREKMASAIEKVREQYDGSSPYLRNQVRCESHVAVCYLVLGDHAKAIEILERATRLDSFFPLDRYIDLWFIFDRLQGDPRFDALVSNTKPQLGSAL